MRALDFTTIKLTRRDAAELVDNPPALWQRYGCKIPDDPTIGQVLKTASEHGLVCEYWSDHPEFATTHGRYYREALEAALARL